MYGSDGVTLGPLEVMGDAFNSMVGSFWMKDGVVKGIVPWKEVWRDILVVGITFISSVASVTGTGLNDVLEGTCPWTILLMMVTCEVVMSKK